MDGATIEVGTLQRIHRGLGRRVVGEFHEPEPAAATALAIGDYMGGRDRPVRAKGVLQRLIVRVPGKIPDKQLVLHNKGKNTGMN